MPRLVLNVPKQIHGRMMRAGEEFDCTDKEAIVWRGKGWASDAPMRRGPGRPRKDDPRYHRMDMRAEDE